MIEQYSEEIKRESNLIIYSAFVGAFMSTVINKLLIDDSFWINLIMALIFIFLLYLVVPRTLKTFKK